MAFRMTFAHKSRPHFIHNESYKIMWNIFTTDSRMSATYARPRTLSRQSFYEYILVQSCSYVYNGALYRKVRYPIRSIVIQHWLVEHSLFWWLLQSYEKLFAFPGEKNNILNTCHVLIAWYLAYYVVSGKSEITFAVCSSRRRHT